MEKKVQGIRSISGRYKIEEVKNTIGNGEAKELTCMTHAHELRWGNGGGRGYRAEGNKGKKKMGHNQ